MRSSRPANLSLEPETKETWESGGSWLKRQGTDLMLSSDSGQAQSLLEKSSQSWSEQPTLAGQAEEMMSQSNKVCLHFKVRISAFGKQ